MRKLILKPFPLAILAVFVLVLSPFNVPPIDKAHGDMRFIEVDLPKEDSVIIIMPIERTPEASKEFAKKQLSKYGWENQWMCLEDLWAGESGWRPDAYNSTPVFQNGRRFHAGGIPQILGLDISTTVEEQVRRGLEYVKSRYGTPCVARGFWHRNFWY